MIGPARRSAALVVLAAVLALAGSPARAAGPPELGPTWAGEVAASSARLHSTITPNSLSGSPKLSTSYRFDYIPLAAYEANLGEAKEGFSGALHVPSGAEAPLGTGTTPIAVSQQLSGLATETRYRYRLVAHNSAGTVTSPTLGIVTQGFGGGALLLDGRGWEMVSPVEKNGGQVDLPGALAGGGVQQAAANGNSATFSSSSSFGEGAEGAPAGSQYVSTRGTGGWTTENITAPLLSGSYGDDPEGVPYRLFSGDLGRGLLLNGDHCRGGGEGCGVANPPLPGTEALAGYQNYYLREGAGGGFTALVTGSALAFTPLTAARFDLSFVGASADLRHVVLSTCAGLTTNAIEVPLGEGCDPAERNLYEWSEGQLQLLNLLPGDSQGTPGAVLGAEGGAVSADGSRVYFTQGGDLYLREGGGTKKVAGAGAVFQTASVDGSTAFYTMAGHLFRYLAPGAGSSTDLTPSGEVQGVLGASNDGAYVYYLSDAGLRLRHGATTTVVAPTADASNYPPATGTSRVSADGTHVAFISTVSLTGFDNVDHVTGEPDSQVYLYDTGSGLVCVSCNPTEERPIGRSTIPGAIANGEGPDATDSYKPRALAAAGLRLFFESGDALVLADTNRAPDVYEWEAQGMGSCTSSGGCLALVSSGKAEGVTSFVDSSSDGSDVFFITPRSLVGVDPGSSDLYDARVGGGFPEPSEPIPCEGDACQVLPPEPGETILATLVPGPGNPPVHYQHHRRRKHQKKRHHGRKGKKAQARGHAGGRR